MQPNHVCRLDNHKRYPYATIYTLTSRVVNTKFGPLTDLHQDRITCQLFSDLWSVPVFQPRLLTFSFHKGSSTFCVRVGALPFKRLGGLSYPPPSHIQRLNRSFHSSKQSAVPNTCTKGEWCVEVFVPGHVIWFRPDTLPVPDLCATGLKLVQNV